jgi:hypothetical protein
VPHCTSPWIDNASGGIFLFRVGQHDQTKQCPHCEAEMALELLPGGRSPRTPRCIDRDGPDSVKSEAANWLKGELRSPKQ